jgi:hypothetical protein
MKRVADVAAAGARVAVIGLGTTTFARGFREATGWRGPVLVDGEGAAYRAVALRRLRLWNLFRPRMIKAALRARREGFRQGKVEGDPWQLGGTLVVAPGDRLAYAHRNRNADDDAPLDEVLAAARAARG